MPFEQDDQVLEGLHPTARQPAIHLVGRIEDELGLLVHPADSFRSLTAQAAALASGASMDQIGWHNLAFPDKTPGALAFHLEIARVGSAAGLVGFADRPLEYPGAVLAHVAPWWEDGSPADLTPRQLVYAAVCNLAREEGWRVGGRWHRLQDWCHVERHPAGAKPEDAFASLAATGKLPWEPH